MEKKEPSSEMLTSTAGGCAGDSEFAAPRATKRGVWQLTLFALASYTPSTVACTSCAAGENSLHSRVKKRSAPRRRSGRDSSRACRMCQRRSVAAACCPCTASTLPTPCPTAWLHSAKKSALNRSEQRQPARTNEARHALRVARDFGDRIASQRFDLQKQTISSNRQQQSEPAAEETHPARCHGPACLCCLSQSCKLRQLLLESTGTTFVQRALQKPRGAPVTAAVKKSPQKTRAMRLSRSASTSCGECA